MKGLEAKMMLSGRDVATSQTVCVGNTEAGQGELEQNSTFHGDW